MSSRDFFQHHTVFSRERFLGHVTASGSDPRTGDSLLRYHCERGHLVRVRRGLYATVPAAADARRFRPDPLVVAANCASDAVLAYTSALQFHGVLAYVPTRATFATLSGTRPFTFRGVEYVPVTPPRSVQRFAESLTGAAASRREGDLGLQIETSQRGGSELRVTSLARTIVDALDRADLCGGISEVWRSMDLVPYVIAAHAVDYATRVLDTGATCSRLGFLLDRRRGEWAVTESDLAALRERAASGSTAFPGVDRSRAHFDSRWRVYVPERMLASEEA